MLVKYNIKDSLLENKFKQLRSIVLIVLLLFLTKTSFNQSIVGGSFTVPNEYPWMVDLGGCGGSLVAPNWVITAGHCIGGSTTVGSTVYINAYSRSFRQMGEESRTVSNVYLFPGYSTANNFYRPDVALIELNSPSSHNPVSIISLQSDTMLTETNDSCTVLGWGTDGVSFGSDTLKKVNMVFVDIDFCQMQYPTSILFDYDTVLCAGYSMGTTPSGAGAGDSGGPLFVMKQGAPLLVGVVSGGNGLITTDSHPGLYTKLLNVKDWIDRTISPFAGVEEKVQDHVNVYYSNSNINIDSKMIIDNSVQVLIHDINGRKILSQKMNIEMGRYTISTETIQSSGIYLVSLVNDNFVANYKLFIAK